MSSMMPPAGGEPPIDPPPSPELPGMARDPNQKIVDREAPTPDAARSALVDAWVSRIKRAKGHWASPFKRMREDQDFCRGKQWTKDLEDKRYVANLTLRLVQQRVAFLYAKNPKVVAKRRQKILNTTWDGSQATLQQATQAATMAMQDPSVLMQPEMQPAVQEVTATIQDATNVREQSQSLDNIARTLELLYEYQVDQMTPPFKASMKMAVRRAVTTGVAYVKLGFQRVMGRSPENERRLSDAMTQLSRAEQLSADLADKERTDSDKEAEELRLLIAELQNTQDLIVHEGLTVDYPLSNAIIPDEKTVFLPQFIGADWVAEEYLLTPGEIQRVYGVDVSTSYTAYSRSDGGLDIQAYVEAKLKGERYGGADGAKNCVLVWDVYSRVDGLVYTIADGWPDFLREPAAPEISMERFWPWFVVMFNTTDSDEDIYPPSDVRLVRDQQLEYNRARQGLREHRVAARPKTIVSAGSLNDDDMDKLENHPPNAILEIQGLQPGQDVKQLLQPWIGPGIDPNLYETGPVWEDIQRVTGIAEANMGGTSDTTATQSQISESSRMTSMGSNIDDLTEVMTQLARAAGQILLMNVEEATVKRIVGEGASWPQLTRQEVADEVWLEIEAGSMGRPDAAASVARAQQIFPLLMQIPGIDPEFLAKELLKRLDDDLDLTQAFLPAAPSITMMNAAKPTAPGAGAPAGAGQGAQGSQNAPQEPGQPGSGPRSDVDVAAGARGAPPMMQ